jgi:predicted ArsR family transcriptional regulator
MVKSMDKSTINRKNIENKILAALKQSKQPISTSDIASKLDKSWHTIMRHCLYLELEGKISKFNLGRISAWIIKE